MRRNDLTVLLSPLMSEEFYVFPKTRNCTCAENLNIVDTIQHFPKGLIVAFVLIDKDGV